LDWWGAVSYTFGVVLYIIAAASSIVNDCPNTLLSTDEYVRNTLSFHRVTLSS
jgi:hypothetical protein